MTFREISKFVTDNKDFLTLIISTFVGLVALGTFIKAIFEYKLQGRQKRAELFDKFKGTLKTEPRILQVTQYLEDDNIALSTIPILDRYFFLGFYEQIAIAVNSQLIKKEVAHYMFSYFALRCWESENFWTGINKKSYYWHVFRQYVEQMQKLESKQLDSNQLTKIWNKIKGQKKFKY